MTSVDKQYLRGNCLLFDHKLQYDAAIKYSFKQLYY